MIRRLLYIAAVLMLLRHDAGAQSHSADATAADENAALQMAAEPPEVWRAYDDMSSMSMANRKNAYRALSSSMKAAIWAHHLRKTLVEHPEFTPKQVELIKEYLSLLTPQLFGVESSTPEWWAHVDVPLQELEQRARDIFDPNLARTVFADLAGQSGERPSSSVLEQTASSGRSKRRLTPNIPYCECSTVSDFCLTGYKCVQGGCYFTSEGCGTLWSYSCIGLCIKQEDEGGG